MQAFSLSMLSATYQVEGVDYERMGTLKAEIYRELVDCLKQTRTLKIKIRRILDQL